jgi:hypothetical protein
MAEAVESTKQASPKGGFSARSVPKMAFADAAWRNGFAYRGPAVGQAASAKKRTAVP